MQVTLAASLLVTYTRNSIGWDSCMGIIEIALLTIRADIFEMFGAKRQDNHKMVSKNG
jgi:hypothetical protein